MQNNKVLKGEIAHTAGIIAFVFCVLIISLAGINGVITSDTLFSVAVGIRFLMAVFIAYSVRQITKMFLDLIRPDE
ncbi:hypothetical protein HX773_24615 [Pantoea sp. B9002]|uniref:hypothetical protein n=1 Tax=Pantoea sp. B9002 TaxID=2726979 RepID=UPI0015A0DC95|nr:hypothetical protein [Pantoea sp. B9002]NWA64085.1 hypothetical protein [Pantoea sp. B9002]